MRSAPGRCWKRWREPDAAGLALLRDAADAMRLSARGYHRVLRVARTLADLDGAEKVGRMHLAEALSYRALADEIGGRRDSTVPIPAAAWRRLIAERNSFRVSA